MALKLSEEHYYALDNSLRFAAQKFVLTSVNMDTLTPRIKLHHVLPPLTRCPEQYEYVKFIRKWAKNTRIMGSKLCFDQH